MEHKIKLSVIIAYYNAEEYIAELLDSLLDQGFSDDEYEIIVVDDESTHDVSVLKQYSETHDNVHYVWQKNARQSAARNRGISMAKGEYIYVCDNDDKVNRQVLGKIYDIAHQNALEILFFNRIKIGENDSLPIAKIDFVLKHDVVSGQQYIANHPYISTGPWHYIIKRIFIDQNNYKFPDGIIICEDVNFLIDVCIKAERVSYLDVDVYYWVQRSKSISHYEGKKKNTEKFLADMYWYIDQKKCLINNGKDLSPTFIRWIDTSINYHVFRLLHTAFRYLPFSLNKRYMRDLQSIGVYPIKNGDFSDMKTVSLVRKIMNNKTLWLTLCFIFQSLPEKIKCKLC